jgi:sulfur-oxidizing protein SoxY
MDPLRRDLLKSAGTSFTISTLLASGLLKPKVVLAADWRQRQAFTATTLGESLKAYGAQSSMETRDIIISTAEITENGAQVPIEIVSNIPGDQSIAVFVEKNPMPLAASLNFANGALPQVRLQLKMAESSRLRVVVKAADGKIYHANREVKVTLGGCG